MLVTESHRWTLFFREQVRCRCGHTRGEHRSGLLRRILRLLTGHPDACTACSCRGFEPAKG